MTIPREADPSGNHQGGCRRADPALWRWRQRAGLAVCCRQRRRPSAGGHPWRDWPQILRGGQSERTNNQTVEAICNALDDFLAAVDSTAASSRESCIAPAMTSAMR